MPNNKSIKTPVLAIVTVLLFLIAVISFAWSIVESVDPQEETLCVPIECSNNVLYVYTVNYKIVSGSFDYNCTEGYGMLVSCFLNLRDRATITRTNTFKINTPLLVVLWTIASLSMVGTLVAIALRIWRLRLEITQIDREITELDEEDEYDLSKPIQ